MSAQNPKKPWEKKPWAHSTTEQNQQQKHEERGLFPASKQVTGVISKELSEEGTEPNRS